MFLFISGSGLVYWLHQDSNKATQLFVEHCKHLKYLLFLLWAEFNDWTQSHQEKTEELLWKILLSYVDLSSMQSCHVFNCNACLPPSCTFQLISSQKVFLQFSLMWISIASNERMFYFHFHHYFLVPKLWVARAERFSFHKNKLFVSLQSYN